MRLRRRVALVVTIVLVALGSGCSSDDGEVSTGSDRAAPATAPAEPAPSADPLIVTTDLGRVRGVESETAGVRAFHAMPYAAEPTGANRWRPPQPRAPYAGTYDATRVGASCPQRRPGDLAVMVIPAAAEDCLTVSAWAPDAARGLPVLVWIHGGSLTGGSAEQPSYIGDELAAKGAVVVGVNYRLGPFGFLATPGLSAEQSDGSVGNYGFLDQVAALRWVHRNISAFGGDPGNVTIFGQSAGGWSVCAHLASPSSAGLFAKAIAQSGCDMQQDRDAALAAGSTFARGLGCDDVACLRSLPTERLLEPEFAARLVTDGVTLDRTASDAAAAGDLAGIPVLIGSTADEATLFLLGRPEPTEDELRAAAATMTDRPDELLALYPPAAGATTFDRLVTMLSDVTFVCPTLAFAEASTSDTFVYHYTFDPGGGRANLGATHGAELVPLFGHPEGISFLPPELIGPAVGLGDELRNAWVSFAATGDPGARFEPFAERGSITILDVPFRVDDQIRDGRCPTVSALTGDVARGMGGALA
jgi:para-nitrobenzyl esterase